MADRFRRAVPALVALVLFAAALEVLRTELRQVSWHELTADILRTPLAALAFALTLTILNYAVLTGYDFLAFRYIRKRLPPGRVAVASFLAYAIANNVGFAMLSGASVRYRFYTRWGVTAEELSRIVFFYVATFWLGLLLLGGLSLAVIGVPGDTYASSPVIVRGAGVLLMLVALAYFAAAVFSAGPIRIGRAELPMPAPALAAAQIGVSVLDWTLAGAVLFVLLPAGAVPFLALLGAFLAAQLLGLASHVPGGMGVFEGLMVLLLKPWVPTPALLPALIVYRAVFYLLPLAGALLVLVADELRQRRSQAARLGAMFGWLSQQLTPRLLSIFTFLAGVVLLLSGATPAAAGRLGLLDRVLPLGVIEVSHFMGSVVGAALLLLSQGIARRLDAAFYLTAMSMAIGIAASLLKGADYEEALMLAAVLLVLWRARPAFDRRAALFDTRFSASWIVAVIAAIVSSWWLARFAFKHVNYSSQLWWQFELHGEASRVLRASVGAAVTVLLFAVARLLGHAPHEAEEPTDEELAAAGRVIASQSATLPYLAFLRDKALLFDEAQAGFVMYGVQGRTWVALGDPVGPEERLPALVQRFLERSDDFGGVPVFYEISSEHLHHYADVGLTFVKLGEEARVDLSTFTLDGGKARRYRQVLRHLEKEGASFRVVPSENVGCITEQLKAVSDEWLESRAGAEKGFSLGFFDPAYIARFPVAVVERGGEVLAFANLWPGSDRVELSVDLMRFNHQAPKDVMEALFLHVIMWGQQQGYRWFSLGMAPLSGFETSPVAPLWNKWGSFIYNHAHAVYNFRGLRAYKEKFDPVWQPRYLAYPGGLRLPRILADISALVAGGYRRILLHP